MHKSYCRGCNSFDETYSYCNNHETNIRNVEDCEDYWNPDNEMEAMFGSDGPDDGFDWGND